MTAAERIQALVSALDVEMATASAERNWTALDMARERLLALVMRFDIAHAEAQLRNDLAEIERVWLEGLGDLDGFDVADR